MTAFAAGALVRARGREWVVLPESAEDFLVLRPLGGGEDDVTAVLPDLEAVEPATFPPPTVDDLGDAASAGLLRTALRIGFRSGAGPFRSLASLAVEPRAYQLVPLLMALRQDTVRLLIADDVGIGKTIEAALVAAELLAQGDAQRPDRAVLTGAGRAVAGRAARQVRPRRRAGAALHRDPAGARPADRASRCSSATRSPWCPPTSSSHRRRRDEFLRACPDLVIVDEAHTCVADGTGQGGGARTQRYELLQRLAEDPNRHLILVTATPHSGAEDRVPQPARAAAARLATLDLASTAGRGPARPGTSCSAAAPTSASTSTRTPPFPRDRHTREVPYRLHPDYRALFERVLAYAREQVVDADTAAVAPAGALVVRAGPAPRAGVLTREPRPPPCAPAPRPRRPPRWRRPTRSAAPPCSTPATTTPSEVTDATPGADAEGEPTDNGDRRHRTGPRPPPAAGAGPGRRSARRARPRRQAHRLVTTRSRACSPTATTRSCSAGSSTPPSTSPSTSAGCPRPTASTVAAVTGALPPAERAAAHRRTRRRPRPGTSWSPPTACPKASTCRRTSRPSSTTTWPGTPPGTSSAKAASTGSARRRDIVRAVTLYGRDNAHRRHRPRRPAAQAPKPSARPPACRCRCPTTATPSSRRSWKACCCAGRDPEQLTLDLDMRRAHRRARPGLGVRRRARRRRPAPTTPSTPSTPRRSPPRSPRSAPASARHADLAAFTERSPARPRRLRPSRAPTAFTAVTATLAARAARRPRRPAPSRCRSTATCRYRRGHALLARTDP